MIYLCALDQFAQQSLTAWFQNRDLPQVTPKALQKLADLQENLELARPPQFSPDESTQFSKILITQGKALFRHHRNLENHLWPIQDAGFTLHFWLDIDPKAKLLLHFEEPELTLARSLQADQRNAYQAESLQQTWLEQATFFLQLHQRFSENSLLVHNQMLGEHPHEFVELLHAKFQLTLQPDKISVNQLEPSPIDHLLARGLLLDHLDIQEIYAELINQSELAPTHEYHEKRFVENLRQHWEDYAHVETVSELLISKDQQSRALAEMENRYTELETEHAKKLTALSWEFQNQLEGVETQFEQTRGELLKQLQEENERWQDAEHSKLNELYKRKYQAELSIAKHHWLAEQEWRFSEQFEEVEARTEEAFRTAYRSLHRLQQQDRERFETKIIQSYEAKLDKARQQRSESQEENELLLMQLHQVQEELEKSFLDSQQLKSELSASQQSSEQLKKSHQQEVNLLQQSHQQELKKVQTELALRAQDQKSAERFKEAEEENELLLLQLHQVQEELEHYFLEYKRLQGDEVGSPPQEPARATREENSTKKLSLWKRLRRKLKTRKEIRFLKKFKAVDSEFYLQRYPDVASSKLSAYDHYVRFGWKEGRQPHPYFDGERYLYLNPDVRSSGQNPLTHWFRHGRQEGRPGGFAQR